MDRNVTVRFYEIEPVGNAGLSFDDTLRHVWGQPPANREAEVGDGIRMRLEFLEETDGFLLGDFTRVQTENLPSHPTANSTDPLPIDRLGHHTAFCYDPSTDIIALQFDIKMAVGRVVRYANAFSGGRKFGYLPVLRHDALERFEQETPTKLTVRVAKVHQFGDFNDEIGDFERGIEQMGALFDAPVVEVTVGARGKDGGLEKETAVDTVKRLLGLREKFNGIRAITASTDESDDPFNFVKALLKISDTLDLPANNPDLGRTLRIAFARHCYDDQLDYLQATYGAGPGA